MGANWVMDSINADTPQARRERLRLYRATVSAIAMNDDPTEKRLTEVAGTVAVGLTATVFDKHPEQVARAVIRIRRAEGL